MNEINIYHLINATVHFYDEEGIIAIAVLQRPEGESYFFEFEQKNRHAWSSTRKWEFSVNSVKSVASTMQRDGSVIHEIEFLGEDYLDKAEEIN